MPARVPMTERERSALLALPADEEMVVRVHTLDSGELAGVATARTPETRLGYALQLCALRYPGRHLRRGEVIPAAMLEHIADQLGIDPAHVAGFARRGQSRYEQLASIKRRHGFRDLNRPLRSEMKRWLADRASGIANPRLLLSLLIAHMRERRIVIPGITVVERMTAEAMHAADLAACAEIDGMLDDWVRRGLDALLSDKEHARQSRLSWLREPPGRVSAGALAELLDKLDLVRSTGATALAPPSELQPRMAQMAREGVRFTAQAFQQMTGKRRYATMVATLRELEATLTDAALAMFRALVARANLRARKRLEETIAASADQGRERLARIADVLDALATAAKRGGDVISAVTSVAPLDVIAADAALLRRNTTRAKPNVVSELAPEHRTFKQVGHRFLASFAWEGRAGSKPLVRAMAALAASRGDHRCTLAPDLPLAHVEHRFRRHVLVGGKVDRVYWELATYFALADALAAGDIWVPTSRLHRSLDELLAPPPDPAALASPLAAPRLAHPLGMTAEAWLADAATELDGALLETARGWSGQGDKLRFPSEPRTALVEDDQAKRLGERLYGLVPTTRVTDVLTHVARWTGFTDRFRHVSTGMPPDDERTLLAALLAEATNLGLSRMAEVCGVASRRALIRMQTWHMREETFRPALACLTDAIHAEPMSAWFGEGWRASADGQHFLIGGPGHAEGRVNAHYGRDPIVKIYTTITDRYAPLHQTVIAGTAGEAVHALDGLLGHESGVDVSALHVDGGGVSDIVFAVMHLLGLDFEPRLPRLSDRRLYAFEPRARYGRLAPLFGNGSTRRSSRRTGTRSAA
jgi:TnpA family transposase